MPPESNNKRSRKSTSESNGDSRAEIIQVPNVNQDVGALMGVMAQVDFTDYGFICKIHSKKGNKCPEKWRRALLDDVLGGKAQVERTIELFQTADHPA